MSKLARRASEHFVTLIEIRVHLVRVKPVAFFSKVPKVSFRAYFKGATIPFISSQRRGSKPSNFAILLVFLTLKAC